MFALGKIAITKYLNAKLVSMEIEKFSFHKHGSRFIRFVTKYRGKGMLPAFPGSNEWCSPSLPSSHQSPQLLQLSPTVHSEGIQDGGGKRALDN